MFQLFTQYAEACFMWLLIKGCAWMAHFEANERGDTECPWRYWRKSRIISVTRQFMLTDELWQSVKPEFKTNSFCPETAQLVQRLLMRSKIKGKSPMEEIYLSFQAYRALHLPSTLQLAQTEPSGGVKREGRERKPDHWTAQHSVNSEGIQSVCKLSGAESFPIIDYLKTSCHYMYHHV